MLAYWDALSAFMANSPYVAGLVMILLNTGTSYLMQDLAPIMHRVFKAQWVRRLVFFAIFFTATRQLFVSLVLTIAASLFLDVLLNPDSRWCLHRSDGPRRAARFRQNARSLLD